VFHGQALAIRGQGPTVTEIHLACTKPHPGFNHEFWTFPAGGSANGYAIQQTPVLLTVSPTFEDYFLFASVDFRDDNLFLQFRI
jgi:hypothetical protein